jgi:hypothetical protein
MELSKGREVVLEIECVRTFRKRAVTRLLHCPECRRETDFLGLAEAACLFDTPVGTLVEFVDSHHCHRASSSDGEVFICLIALLAAMKTKTEKPEIRPIEGTRS